MKITQHSSGGGVCIQAGGDITFNARPGVLKAADFDLHLEGYPSVRCPRCGWAAAFSGETVEINIGILNAIVDGHLVTGCDKENT